MPKPSIGAFAFIIVCSTSSLMPPLTRMMTSLQAAVVENAPHLARHRGQVAAVDAHAADGDAVGLQARRQLDHFARALPRCRRCRSAGSRPPAARARNSRTRSSRRRAPARRNAPWCRRSECRSARRRAHWRRRQSRRCSSRAPNRARPRRRARCAGRNRTRILPGAASTMRAAFDAISVWKCRMLISRVSTSCACGSGAVMRISGSLGKQTRAFGDRMHVAGEAESRRDNRAGCRGSGRCF